MLLGKILESYFTDENLRALSEKFLDKTALLVNEWDGEDLPDSRMQIDFLLTYAHNVLDSTRYIHLLIHLGEYTLTTGEFTSAVEIFERIIHLTRQERSLNNITANAYYSLGEIYSRQAKWEMSIGYIKKADLLFRKIKDFKGSARCSNLLGTIYGDFGELRIAENYLHRSLDLLKDGKDEALKGMVEINIGIIQDIRGNSKTAVMYLQRALLKFQTIQNRKRIAEIRSNIGAAYFKMKDYDSAVREFDAAISLAAEEGFLSTTAICLVYKAHIFALKNDTEAALALSDKAMELCFRINDRLSVAEVYKIKGIIQKMQKNYELAEGYLLTSIRINRELQNKLNTAESLIELGFLYRKINKLKESRTCFSDALEYFKKINAKEEINKLESYLNS